MNNKNVSFESFFVENYIIAQRYINKKINNYHESEDLAMDSFLMCYKHFSKYDERKASLKTWLYFIINNRIKNFYRDKKEFVELDENVKYQDSIEDSIYYIDKIMELRNHLTKAIRNLPEVQQKIIILRFFGEKTIKEISDIVNMTEGNIRVIISRSLKKIKKYFEVNNIKMEL